MRHESHRSMEEDQHTKGDDADPVEIRSTLENGQPRRIDHLDLMTCSGHDTLR